ncbi:MAG: hypothetical protein ACOZNI_14125 [Myxococcota bacterium]
MLLRSIPFLALCLLACGGMGGSDVATQSPAPAAPTTPVVWDVVSDGEGMLVVAGAPEGIVLDMTVALVTAPPAHGAPRPLAGSARITQVGTQSRIVPLRLVEGVTPTGARQLLPEDQAALATIPEYREPTKAATAKKSAASSEPQVPADLRTGTADERADAVARYEDDPNATWMIVWVMKNDASYEVRQKAWRVVRARWKRGTGSNAEHEAAARWLLAHGSPDQQKEAQAAIDDLARD